VATGRRGHTLELLLDHIKERGEVVSSSTFNIIIIIFFFFFFIVIIIDSLALFTTLTGEPSPER
jgi:hypothetical protein